MSTPLLATKLYIPPLHSKLVRRPHLLERLNAGLDITPGVTLIAAPAGFGKTTLVVEWIEQINGQLPNIAWFSLDEADNDPVRFFTYFVAALQTINAEWGQSTQSILDAPQPLDPEVLMTTLINDIATNAAPDSKIILVLDDYHIIENQTIHNALTFLLDHMPPQIHLVLTSRADPPLPLSRLRARRRLVELRATDLRFTPGEATIFLNEITGLHLSSGNVLALENRTEGWIAGLQLAALSLQGQNSGNTSAFIANFTGDDRYVVDYLVEEVLDRQPDDIKRFLLLTSILDRLNGPLCDTLTGTDILEAGASLKTGQDILEYLEQVNLFTIPLDNKRDWYRYHHLFMDLLRLRLRQQITDADIAQLHQRASEWLEQAGLIEEAINHAFAADNLERVAHLLGGHALPLLRGQGNLHTILKWLETLPIEQIYRRPQLCTLYSWVLFEMYPGQESKIAPLLQAAETELLKQLETAQTTGQNTDQIQTLLGEIDLLRANFARRRGETQLTISLCHKTLTRISSNENYVRGAALFTLGATLDSLGNMIEAEPNYIQGIEITQKQGNHYAALINVAKLIDLHMIRAQFHRAEAVFQQYQQMAQTRHGADTGMFYVNYGWLLLEQNKLETAHNYLTQGVNLCRPVNAMALMVVKGYIGLAWVERAKGNPAAALEMAHNAERFKDIDKMPYPAVRFEAARARLWLALGDLPAAARWAEQSGPGIDDELSYLLEIDHLTLARVLIAQNNLDDAAKLLGRLRNAAGEGGRTGRVIEIDMLQALLYQAQDEDQRAVDTLAEVLSKAEPEGYVRLFVDEGEPMAALLKKTGIKSGRLTPYIQSLLSNFQNTHVVATAITPAQSQPLVEPLTERELKTLQLLATELSPNEIADEMVVAISTVRSYTKKIYSKLDAHSRIEAVHRARELGLL